MDGAPLGLTLFPCLVQQHMLYSVLSGGSFDSSVKNTCKLQCMIVFYFHKSLCVFISKVRIKIWQKSVKIHLDVRTDENVISCVWFPHHGKNDQGKRALWSWRGVHAAGGRKGIGFRVSYFLHLSGKGQMKPAIGYWQQTIFSDLLNKQRKNLQIQIKR